MKNWQKLLWYGIAIGAVIIIGLYVTSRINHKNQAIIEEIQKNSPYTEKQVDYKCPEGMMCKG